MAAPTLESVRSAIREYERIGEREFLHRYSNGRSARDWYLIDNDELYDLKAIWGAAHEPPLAPARFHTSSARSGAFALGLQVIDATAATSHRDYKEGTKRTAETTFFSRNSRLVADAKRKYGTRCVCCGFDFGNKYGKHGIGYIECHHKNELARDWERDTKLEDVAVVCSNCHRMIHRRQNQILSIEALRKIINRVELMQMENENG